MCHSYAVFKLLSYFFKETIGFDIYPLFTRPPALPSASSVASHETRWHNKRISIKGYQSHGSFHGLETESLKFNLHHLQKMSLGKHNGCANSKIRYIWISQLYVRWWSCTRWASPNILIFGAHQRHIYFFEKIFDSEVALDYIM